MADKVKKFLARLSRREFDSVQALLLDIKNNELDHLDVKPLKGKPNYFRVRKGRIRVIFVRHNQENLLISISRRDDRTYSQF